jgi:Ni/Co efflux regulator RcnB
MKRKTLFLAALLFAGASQAAMAQDRDHGDRGDRPAAQPHAGGPPGGHAPAAAPQVQAAPPAAQIAPQGGHARFGAPPPPGGGAPAPPAPLPGAVQRHDGDRRFDGDRHFDGDRRGGDRNGFAPGGTAPGDRHWDRHDAPREVIPPGAGERGWDREHDGHAADARQLNRDGRGDGRWDRDRDHRGGPPANWQHWERGRFPPVYASSHRFRTGPYRPPYGWYVRSWGFGDFLPRGWYGPGYWVDDFYDYDLPYPPPGYHWVRVGGDVLLVDDYTGRIVQVVRDLFW